MSAQIIRLDGEKAKRSTWQRIRAIVNESARERDITLTESQMKNIRGAVDYVLQDAAFTYQTSFPTKEKHDFLAVALGFSNQSNTRGYRIIRHGTRNRLEVRDIREAPSPSTFAPRLQREFAEANRSETESERQEKLDRIEKRLANFTMESRIHSLVRAKNWLNKRSHRYLSQTAQTRHNNIDCILSIDDLMALTRPDRAVIAAAIIGHLRGDPESVQVKDIPFGDTIIKFNKGNEYAAEYYARHDSDEGPLFNEIMTVLDDAFRQEVEPAFNKFYAKLDAQAVLHLKELPGQATPELYNYLLPTRRDKHTKPVDADKPNGKKKVWYERVIEREKGERRFEFLSAYPLFALEGHLERQAATRRIDALGTGPLGDGNYSEEQIDQIAASVWAGLVESDHQIATARVLRGVTADQIGRRHFSRLKAYMPYIGEMVRVGATPPAGIEQWDHLDMLAQIDHQVSKSGIKPPLEMFKQTMADNTSLDAALNFWMVDRDDGQSYALETLRDYYESVPSRLMMVLLASRKKIAEQALIKPLEDDLKNHRGSRQLIKQKITKYRHQLAELTPQLIEQVCYPDSKGFRRRSVQREINEMIEHFGNLSLSGHMFRKVPLRDQLNTAKFFTANNQEMIDGLREIKLSTAFSGHAANFGWPTLPQPPSAFYRDYMGGDASRRVTFIDRGDQLNREAVRLGIMAQAPWRYISENVHFLIVEKSFDQTPVALAVLEEIQGEDEPVRLAFATLDDFSNDPELYVGRRVKPERTDDIRALVEHYIDWANQQEFDALGFEEAREKLEDKLQPNMGLEARIGYKFRDKFNSRQFFRLVSPHIPQEYRDIDDDGFLQHPDLVRMVDDLICHYVPDYEDHTGLRELLPPEQGHQFSSASPS